MKKVGWFFFLPRFNYFEVSILFAFALSGWSIPLWQAVLIIPAIILVSIIGERATRP